MEVKANDIHSALYYVKFTSFIKNKDASTEIMCSMLILASVDRSHPYTEATLGKVILNC